MRRAPPVAWFERQATGGDPEEMRRDAERQGVREKPRCGLLGLADVLGLFESDLFDRFVGAGVGGAVDGLRGKLLSLVLSRLELRRELFDAAQLALDRVFKRGNLEFEDPQLALMVFFEGAAFDAGVALGDANTLLFGLFEGALQLFGELLGLGLQLFKLFFTFRKLFLACFPSLLFDLAHVRQSFAALTLFTLVVFLIQVAFEFQVVLVLLILPLALTLEIVVAGLGGQVLGVLLLGPSILFGFEVLDRKSVV